MVKERPPKTRTLIGPWVRPRPLLWRRQVRASEQGPAFNAAPKWQEGKKKREIFYDFPAIISGRQDRCILIGRPIVTVGPGLKLFFFFINNRMEGGGSLTLRKFPIVRLSVIFFLLLKVVTVVNYEAGRATHALTHTHTRCVQKAEFSSGGHRPSFPFKLIAFYSASTRRELNELYFFFEEGKFQSNSWIYLEPRESLNG